MLCTTAGDERFIKNVAENPRSKQQILFYFAETIPSHKEALPERMDIKDFLYPLLTRKKFMAAKYILFIRRYDVSIISTKLLLCQVELFHKNRGG